MTSFYAHEAKYDFCHSENYLSRWTLLSPRYRYEIKVDLIFCVIFP